MATQKGLLTETDLIKIGNLIDAKLDVKLDQKLANYPTKAELDQILETKLEKKLEAKLEEKIGKLPTKDEFTQQLSEALKSIQDKSEEEDVHDLQHENLGKDTTKLKQQVQHLFNTFEIKDPTDVVPSY